MLTMMSRRIRTEAFETALGSLAPLPFECMLATTAHRGCKPSCLDCCQRPKGTRPCAECACSPAIRLCQYRFFVPRKPAPDITERPAAVPLGRPVASTGQPAICPLASGRVALRPRLRHNRLCQYRFFVPRKPAPDITERLAAVPLGQLPALASRRYARLPVAVWPSGHGSATTCCASTDLLCHTSQHQIQNVWLQ